MTYTGLLPLSIDPKNRAVGVGVFETAPQERDPLIRTVIILGGFGCLVQKSPQLLNHFGVWSRESHFRICSHLIGELLEFKQIALYGVSTRTKYGL